MPSVEEITKILRKVHGHGIIDHYPWINYTLKLPAGSHWPVDFYNKSDKYSVTILLDNQRNENDPVIHKTLPYLETLAKAGVLTKKEVYNMRVESGETSKSHHALVFDLSPEFEPRKGKAGFNLGIPSVDVVKIEIFDKGYLGQKGASYKYKLKVKYNAPPVWAKDPKLLNQWPELKGVIENGMACSGEFEFDKIKRENSDGYGSCWTNFESVFEE
ncbi:MAG: hypothetical protein KBE30_00670 [Desulfobacter sp.]|nr:hypothetical protein [Desulfobacter sp.]